MNIDELEGRLDRLSDPVGQIGVAPADDVRRGHRALRRRRLVQVGAAAAAVAVVATGSTLLLNRDDEPQPAASALEPITWDSLQPGAVNPVFPGQRPLLVELDANSVPLLHEVFSALGSDAKNVRPPESSSPSTVRKGVPAIVVGEFGWQGAETDIWFRLSASKAAALTEIPWFCNEKCTERTVAGHRISVSTSELDEGPDEVIWGFRQDDGEFVMFDAEALPDGLSAETFVRALAGADLPDQDLTPARPGQALAEKIGRDHFESGGGQLRKIKDGGGRVTAELLHPADRIDTVSWWAEEMSGIDPEDDAPCDPEDYVSCGDRVIAGDKVHLMWEYRAAGASVTVQFDGEVKRVSVRVPYAGKPGTGAPVVPLGDLAALVTDPRWQK